MAVNTQPSYYATALYLKEIIFPTLSRMMLVNKQSLSSGQIAI